MRRTILQDEDIQNWCHGNRESLRHNPGIFGGDFYWIGPRGGRHEVDGYLITSARTCESCGFVFEAEYRPIGRFTVNECDVFRLDYRAMKQDAFYAKAEVRHSFSPIHKDHGGTREFYTPFEMRNGELVHALEVMA